MSEDQQTILMIKGAVSELPSEQQEQFHECNRKVLNLLKEYPETFPLVIALMGATMSMND